MNSVKPEIKPVMMGLCIYIVKMLDKDLIRVVTSNYRRIELEKDQQGPENNLRVEIFPGILAQFTTTPHSTYEICALNKAISVFFSLHMDAAIFHSLFTFQEGKSCIGADKPKHGVWRKGVRGAPSTGSFEDRECTLIELFYLNPPLAQPRRFTQAAEKVLDAIGPSQRQPPVQFNFGGNHSY